MGRTAEEIIEERISEEEKSRSLHALNDLSMAAMLNSLP